MSLINQFTIGCSKTINLGNFQSIRIEASIVVEVPEHETQASYEVLIDNAQAELRRLLELTWKSQHKKGSYDE